MYRIAFLGGSWALLCLLFSCKQQDAAPALPYYNTPDFSPIFLETSSQIEQQITHKISDFSFTNQHGKSISQQDIEDKIHIANFIFTTCPSICPVMTEHVKSVSKTFTDDPDFAILSFSVTPWIDDVDRLATYAKSEEIIANNWHFLTGDKGEIYDLARTSYFAEEDLGYTKDSTEFLHTEHILLVDQDKRIRGIYNGTLQLEIKQLIADIHTLKQSR